MAIDKNKISAEATKLVQKGQFDKAIKTYQKILGADPNDVRVLLKIGELYQKKGDTPSAAETFGRVAESYAEQGFFLKSVAVYKQMAKLAPEDVQVNERLAGLYQQLGLLSESMAQLHIIAAAAEKAGDDAKLLEYLRRIVEIDPENVVATIKLGDAYARKSQANQALEHLRRAAEVLQRNNRTEEYLKVSEKIAALVPDDMALGREVASMLLARGDAKRALAKLQLCFKADPKDLRTLELLAKAFEDLGQTTKMASVFRELAKLHADGGRVEAARESWRRLLALVPDDPEALQATQVASPQPLRGETSGALPLEPPAVIVPAAPRAPAAIVPEPPPATSARAPEPASPTPQPSSPAPAATSATPVRPPPAGLDAIPRLLSETDVYVKYALHEKALDHLSKVFAIDPDHLGGHEKALRVRELLGDVAGAADEALRVVRIALAQNAHDRARAALERARSLAPNHPDLPDLAATLALPTVEVADLESDGVVLEIDLPESDHDDLALSAVVAGGDEVVDDGPAAVADEGEAVPDEPVGVLAGRAETSPEDDVVVEPEPSVAPDDALQDDLAEVDFFISQRLFDEAREVLDALAAAYPDHPEIGARLQEIQRQDRPVASPATSDYLYSVRDVLEPFKKQVEQTVTPEDSATHYDLGIAYKEMGLLDDAIREFEIALGGSTRERQADCLAMMGLCRLAKGDASGAVEAYQSALLRDGVSADARRDLQYQLAKAHEAAGDRDAALWYLNRVVDGEAGYRDAQSLLLRLGGGAGRRPADDPAGAAGGERDPAQPADDGEPQVGSA